MAGLARRLGPAAALGGLAVVIVGIADPALAGRAAQATADQAPQAATAQTESPQSATPQTETPQTETPQADATPSDTATAGDCSTGDTVTGDSVMTRWGPVQVAATVSGTRVCEVHALAWPSNDGRSQQINAYAIPALDQMATASEGTQLDYASGATYTSGAYAQSLQSILDAL